VLLFAIVGSINMLFWSFERRLCARAGR